MHVVVTFFVGALAILPREDGTASTVSSAFVETTDASAIADADQKQDIAVSFTGTVKDVEPLGNRALTAILVGVDPRFVLTVRVESVMGCGAPLQQDTDAIFAIHSPARLFLMEGKGIVGEQFSFRLRGSREGRETRYVFLEATPMRR